MATTANPKLSPGAWNSIRVFHVCSGVQRLNSLPRCKARKQAGLEVGQLGLQLALMGYWHCRQLLSPHAYNVGPLILYYKGVLWEIFVPDWRKKGIRRYFAT